MQELYLTSLGRGRRMYGDKYYSMEYLNQIHTSFAGASDCDHMHEGRGFLTSHAALTLMFEQALQAVDPSVAVAYWDFTIDTVRLSPIYFSLRSWPVLPLADV